jgi:hypothetical protein
VKLKDRSSIYRRGRWVRASSVLTALFLVTFGLGALGAPAHASTGPVITEGDGFDQTCALDSGQIAQIWDNYSDIFFEGLYLDAPDALAWAAGECPDQATDTDSSAIAADADTGMGLGLFYTGLQAPYPCTDFSGVFSSDSGTAYGQGEDAATSAWDEAEDMGFPKNVYIYNDLEGFSSPDATCVDAAESYVSGWDYQMESLGGHPGLYGSACASDLSSMATSTSPDPEAIWAAWYSDPSHTSDASITCVPDDYWDLNQRIVQWGDSGALSTEGNGDLNDSPVDFDCADGPTMDINYGSGVTLGSGCEGTQ